MAELREYNFIIDVVGTCQLSCPSCPVGNIGSIDTNSKKIMQPELLNKILTKAVTECSVRGVFLHNWTEPTLNKHLPELIRIVKSFGIPCHISTNLNTTKRFASILLAGLDSLKASVSGFSNEVYQRTHRGGDIEVVKKNMRYLSEIKAEFKLNTNLNVFYLRYNDNIDDEFLMKAYAEELGWRFQSAWAQFMPLEKSLALMGDVHANDFIVTDDDKKLLDLLALGYDETLDACKKVKLDWCRLREVEMVLDSSGDATLCCSVYDAKKYRLGNYLDMPITEIQKQRYDYSICRSCMQNGFLALGLYLAPEINLIGVKNVLNNYARRLGYSIS
ncbi:radical SAM protein [Magnetovirga frankeli]|uniref:radical SAM/SPASM domain-containing protein n=1 Tax=Magnetovirga frankeli TaxID=947516 RepID=UPI0012932EE2|nr:radical SAM protein [gamma proteobacterium SS-5]